jgi:RNA exonuclease 4
MKSEKDEMLKIFQDLSRPKLPLKRNRKESQVDSNWKKNPDYRPSGATSESFVALDCEMVSTENDKNCLARVSIVNMECEVLLDLFVKPDEKVVNYRTFVTGIRARHLKYAKSFQEVREQVKRIIKGKIVVGHALHHDLKALKITLDKEKVRDTQTLYAESSGNALVSLQKLTFQTLGKVIQTGQHSSVEDAAATMEIFKTLFLNNKKKKLKVDKRKKGKSGDEFVGEG